MVLTFSLGVAVIQYESVSQEKENYRDRLTTLQSDLGELNTSLENKRDRITQLSSRIDILETDKSELKSENEELETEVNQPLLWASSPTWYEQTTGEYYISFTVYNFGLTQATDIQGECRLIDSEDDTVYYTETIQIGNLASESTDTTSTEFEVSETVDPDDTAYCIIKECDDCLKLRNRISALTQSQDGGFTTGA